MRAPSAIEWAGLARSVPQRGLLPATQPAPDRARCHQVGPGSVRSIAGFYCRQIFAPRDDPQLAQLSALARLSEAIRLRLEDSTPDGLVIRCSKFRKSRLVPLHDTARAGLERYLQQRCPYAPDAVAKRRDF